mgnify:FL=1
MSEQQFDVVALGELLIDFTANGSSEQGNPLFEANPGGAPCNVLAMLQQQYPNIRLLNVTAGAQGSYAFCGSLQAFEPGCTLGGVIETTGAGDTFCACVLHYLLGHSPDSLTRDDLHRMLHFANTAAYLVTTRKGAIRSMPTPEQVQAIL